MVAENFCGTPVAWGDSYPSGNDVRNCSCETRVRHVSILVLPHAFPRLLIKYRPMCFDGRCTWARKVNGGRVFFLWMVENGPLGVFLGDDSHSTRHNAMFGWAVLHGEFSYSVRYSI